MFAILYLLLATVLGDEICRRVLPYASQPHRWAAAFLSGLLVSTWWAYGCAWVFGSTRSPMLYGNIAFLVTTGLAVVLLRSRFRAFSTVHGTPEERIPFRTADWVLTGIFALLACWMMFSTFNMSDGKLQIGNNQWSDFGSNLSIMQSFANGDNFPTEYPHFSGERIHYHFLFYFAAGDLEYLGLDPALSNNVLSILTLLSLLVLVMTLGAVLFRSQAVARIGAVLFFFHGSLAFIPYLEKNGFSLEKIWTMQQFLNSGYTYRGEDWGVWTQVVYLNQRHLASSIGLMLIPVIFLVMFVRSRWNAASVELAPAEDPLPGSYASRPEDEALYEAHLSEPSGAEEPISELPTSATEKPDLPIEQTVVSHGSWPRRLGPFVVLGVVLGLLPMWNGAVFVAAAAVLAIWFILLPPRRELIVLAIVTGAIALPQVIYLRGGNLPAPAYSLWHWGYTVENAGFWNVVEYLLFTFGFKWVPIVIALVIGSRLQRRLFVAASSLILVAFCFQFSEEVLANHKFLNIWLVIANTYAAAGLVWLWTRTSAVKIPARVVVLVLLVLITFGGAIDLLVIKNSYWVEMKYEHDPLIEWVEANTDPRSIFLSYRYVNHPILLAGRKLFYGHPYYAWGAGYPVGMRDQVYKQIFTSSDPKEVLRLLLENNISYVAIDDQLRKNDFVKNPNEWLFEKYFKEVYSDNEDKYDNLKIFEVPHDGVLSTPQNGSAASTLTNAFTGGQGTSMGQFDSPRGLAADTAGNIYVADTGNGRIQKFDRLGNPLFVFGTRGSGSGELKEPNGVAVDKDGNVFVTDAANSKLLKYSPEGNFVKEWKGPESGFFGPRDLAVAPNGHLFIVDQGRTRIVDFDPVHESFTSWGSSGSGDGQFLESTGLTVSGDVVFVADTGNNRIEEFTIQGKFLRQWDVPQWQRYLWHYPDIAFDPRTRDLYVSSGWSNEILVFDTDGHLMSSIKPHGGSDLQGPSSLAMTTVNDASRLLVLNTKGDCISFIDLAPGQP